MNPIISRRSALKSLACGFGYLALAEMLDASVKLLAGAEAVGRPAVTR